MLTFLVGGARSGKSALAVEMAERHGGAGARSSPPPNRSTTTSRPHRPPPRRAAAGWPTVEEPLDLADAIVAAPADALLIVDCLTVWVGNLTVHTESPIELVDRIDDLASALRRRARAPTAHGRGDATRSASASTPRPSSAAGTATSSAGSTRLVAAVADRTLLLVAGRPLRLDDPWELLT